MFAKKRLWSLLTSTCLILSLIGMTTSSFGQHDESHPTTNATDWHESENGVLQNYAQLTSEEYYVKAGEAYFDPDMGWIIYQAVPIPAEGEEPDEHYSMYVAELVYDEADRITGTKKPMLISLPGSANTCGFFHPTVPGAVIFGTTMTPPAEVDTAGYQRGSGRYKWAFPTEMEVVTKVVTPIKMWHRKLRNIRERPHARQFTNLSNREGYDAECAFSPDGRYIVMASMQDNENLCDINIYDMATKKMIPIVEAVGYDGGPFFGPHGKRICYRSDRRGDNLLQLFVGELEFDEDGVITGLKREFQLTDDTNVNWGPYWHPSGRYLAYATSAVSHSNYEVFLIDADPGTLPDSPGAVKYGTGMKRITNANGFDGLPVFSPDGKYMMWTSQRTHDPAVKGSSQIWIAEFTLPTSDGSASPHMGSFQDPCLGTGNEQPKCPSEQSAETEQPSCPHEQEAKAEEHSCANEEGEGCDGDKTECNREKRKVEK